MFTTLADTVFPAKLSHHRMKYQKIMKKSEKLFFLANTKNEMTASNLKERAAPKKSEEIPVLRDFATS